MAIRKFSRQRESIKDYLSGRTDHPTAEAVYLALREKDPKLSLGTVYRNLSLLTELGEIQKISTGDGPDHFDGDASRHQHFICRSCHQVSDLKVKGLQYLMDEAQKQCEGEVEGFSINFYGICEQCNRKAANAE